MSEIQGIIRMIFHNSEEKKIPARLTIKGFDGYFNTFEKAKVKNLKIGDEVKIEYITKTTEKGTLNNIDSIELITKKIDKPSVEETKKNIGEFIPANELPKLNDKEEFMARCVVLKAFGKDFWSWIDPKNDEDIQLIFTIAENYLTTGKLKLGL